MSRTWTIPYGMALGVALVCIAQGDAQQLLAPVPTVDQRLERLEKLNETLLKQNEDLKKEVQTLKSRAETPVSTGGGAVDKSEVQSIISQYLQQQKAEEKKVEAKEKKDAWYQVGTDLKMNTNWKEGLVFTTPHDDFSMHIGGWMQYDNVFWSQSNLLRKPKDGAPAGVASGAPTGGIGDLEDGTYFRRLRIMTDGKFWENYEYTLIYAFENDQFNTAGLDEFWVGATNIPVIGTVRIGHVKNCIGLEADMSASSRTMTFLERSSYSEAIELNQNFVTGLWLGNNYFDQRATWSGVIFRPDAGSSTGAFFGDGQWGWQGRLTALPLFENDGRCLLHVGLSGGYRNGANNLATSPYRVIQLRARPELRDDDPAGAFAGAVGANGNSNRLVDTGVIAADREWLAGLELLYIRGPFSLQAEYGFNWVNDAVGFAPKGTTLNPALPSRQDYFFSGGYVQLAYTLTGENRAYDKRLGRLDSYYFGRKGPYENAYIVRGEDGIETGRGAWEIAARYSYTNLNDGSTTATRIQGGVMDGFSLGLNWYLNTNLKFQFDWVYDRRLYMPTGSFEGYTNGFGVRMQYMF